MYKLYNTGLFSELPGGRVRCEKYPQADITFMTAHSSKGLGYDNVILINMFEGKFGFPCQIEDDPIIKLVTYEDNSMPLIRAVMAAPISEGGVVLPNLGAVDDFRYP